MNQKYNWPWSLGELPFVYTPLSKPSNEDLPDLLPFSLNINRSTGLLIQEPNDLVAEALDEAYMKGSIISGMMDDSGIGKAYAEDFLSFIQSRVKRENLEGLKILEIGCGTGYLLYRLKQLGAVVQGIEPGAHGQLGSEKYKVPIVRGFFPSDEVSDCFDIIILFGVLEHIQNPSHLVSEVIKYLNKDGKIIVSVPNCEPYIRAGDISMLFHEHWNYFTHYSLKQTFKSDYKMELDTENSSFGGFIYATNLTDSNNDGNSSQALEQDILSNISSLEAYRNLALDGIERVFKFIKESLNNQRTLGIYVPSRIVNTLTLLKSEIDISRIRFFDDNLQLHKTYYPGLDIKVESRNDLIENTPDTLLIMSHSFGDKIASELKGIVDAGVCIITWEELFK